MAGLEKLTGQDFVQNWEKTYHRFEHELRAVLPLSYSKGNHIRLLWTVRSPFKTKNGKVAIPEFSVMALDHKVSNDLGYELEDSLISIKAIRNFSSLDESLYFMFFHWLLFRDAKLYRAGKKLTLESLGSSSNHLSLDESVADALELLTFWRTSGGKLSTQNLIKESRPWNYKTLVPSCSEDTKVCFTLGDSEFFIPPNARLEVIEHLIQKNIRSSKTAVFQKEVMQHLQMKGLSGCQNLRDVFKEKGKGFFPEWGNLIRFTPRGKVYLDPRATRQ